MCVPTQIKPSYTLILELTHTYTTKKVEFWETDRLTVEVRSEVPLKEFLFHCLYTPPTDGCLFRRCRDGLRTDLS